MKHAILITILAFLASPVESAEQPAAGVSLTCDVGPSAADRKAPDLHGNWDFLIVPRGMASFGVMSIGVDGETYRGSLSPARTAPVVLKEIALVGNRIHMVVAAREGDVLFDGQLSAKGDLMCGVVTYHGGETQPMIAQRRPSNYPSRPGPNR